MQGKQGKHKPLWDRLLPAVIGHYGMLIGVIGLGAALRLWHLDTKPLWLDEVLTAIFTTGHRSTDIPHNEFLSLSVLNSLFTVQPGLSCSQIAQTVATESVHPPLFFCLMYGWMQWLHPETESWVWALRALPALLGTGAIAAVYLLNRLAFSPAVGLITAALMAVSPFAVYLSQEARHYTLPMLLILLGLIGLLHMQRDLAQHHCRPWVWLGWMAINGVSLYTHYFCLLSLAAQVIALLGWMLWHSHVTDLPFQRRHWLRLGLAISGVFLSYLPWLTMLLSHLQRPETDWLEFRNLDWTERIAPIYQTLIGWVVMAIALPVEDQPWEIALPAAVTMVVLSVALGWQVIWGLKQAWQRPEWRSPLLLLGGFTGAVLVQFALIVYGLGKDITVVPRYNFVYYPGMVALLGLGLMAPQRGQASSQPLSVLTAANRRKSPVGPGLYRAIALLMGLISSVCVVYGFAFQKSYNPTKVVDDLLEEASMPLLVVTHYRSLQEIALGLSITLELRHAYPEGSDRAPVRFAFVDRTEGDRQAWHTLSRLPQPLPMPLQLWVVAPELRKQDFPDRLRLSRPYPARTRVICTLDPEDFQRLGFPYQGYHCGN